MQIRTQEHEDEGGRARKKDCRKKDEIKAERSYTLKCKKKKMKNRSKRRKKTMEARKKNYIQTGVKYN